VVGLQPRLRAKNVMTQPPANVA